MQVNPATGAAGLFGVFSETAASQGETAEFSVPATPVEATPDPMIAVEEAIASLLAKVASPDIPPPDNQIATGSEAEANQQTTDLKALDGDLKSKTAHAMPLPLAQTDAADSGQPVAQPAKTPLWSKQWGYLTFGRFTPPPAPAPTPTSGPVAETVEGSQAAPGPAPAPVAQTDNPGPVFMVRHPVFMYRAPDAKPTPQPMPAQQLPPTPVAASPVAESQGAENLPGPVFMWRKPNNQQPMPPVQVPPSATPVPIGTIQADPTGPVFMFRAPDKPIPAPMPAQQLPPAPVAVAPTEASADQPTGPVFMWRKPIDRLPMPPVQVLPASSSPNKEITMEAEPAGPVFMYRAPDAKGAPQPMPAVQLPAASVSATLAEAMIPQAGALLQVAAELVEQGVSPQRVVELISAHSEADANPVNALAAKLEALTALAPAPRQTIAGAQLIAVPAVRQDFVELLDQRKKAVVEVGVQETPAPTPQAVPTQVERPTATVAPEQVPIPKEVKDRVIQRVAAHIKEMIDARTPRTMTIRLDPPELGSIDLTVKTIGQRVETTIMASNSDVRSTLDANRQQLARSLEGQGLELGSMLVGQQGGSRGDSYGEAAASRTANWRAPRQEAQTAASAWAGSSMTAVDLMV